MGLSTVERVENVVAQLQASRSSFSPEANEGVGWDGSGIQGVSGQLDASDFGESDYGGDFGGDFDEMGGPDGVEVSFEGLVGFQAQAPGITFSPRPEVCHGFCHQMSHQCSRLWHFLAMVAAEVPCI